MSWISAKYTQLKDLWQRFVQWERFAILREKEWRFPVYGTTEDFERRFGSLVPQVPRDEFFRLYKKRKPTGTFGFCADDEVVLKVLNPPPPGVRNFPARRQRSVYYFHGQLNQDSSGTYLYGHFRLPTRMARGLLKWMNGFIYTLPAGLIFLAVAYSLGSWPEAAVQVEIGVKVAQALAYITGLYLLFILTPIGIFFGLMDWLTGRHLEHRDRRACTEAHRLLTEICSCVPP
ncbi:MAG: hypothetical protein HKN28_15030 [Alphaproteobacteria bacterium]|nr:hypothetical protein [Alphaproteobacteria bacterium]